MKTPSSATAPLAILLLAVAPISFVHAQVLYTLESPNAAADGRFGYSVSDAGDVDGDADPDVAVGAPYELVQGLPSVSGRAYVFAGGGATVLQAFEFSNSGPPPYAFLGDFGSVVCGAGDLDNDGCDDLLVSAHLVLGGWFDPYSEGRVHAFSGATGQSLHLWSGMRLEYPAWDGFGCAVDGTGDLNGDGCGDIAIAQLYPYQCRVLVFSGYDGSGLDTLSSPYPEWGGGFGRSVSGLADVDNDDCNDLAVGAPFEDAGAPDAGRAYVLSGSDGSLLHTLVSPYPESAGLFGNSVSGVADVNGDGHEDVIVGAHREDGGAIDAGRAYIFSGSDGVLLYTLVSAYPESAGLFGCSVSGAGDVNADGYGDVVVGAHQEDGGGASGAGRAYIFSGSGGSLLYVLESSYPEAGGFFGFSVSAGGDINGDGRSEVIVGAPCEDGGATNAGRVYVFNGIEVPVELSAFTAEAKSSYVLLQWTTQTEQDNYGFHLYRATSEPVDYERITAGIIPGAGTSTVPHHYSYADRAVEGGVTYFYKLADVDVQGNQTFHGPVSVTVTPARFALLGNQPNPFGETTTIRLSVAAPGHVSLRIYNAAGDLIRTLRDAEMIAGTHEIQWDGRDDAGNHVPPGTYTCRLSSAGQTRSQGLVLVR